MKSYTLSGLNAVEAVTMLERAAGQALPLDMKESLGRLAEMDGGTFTRLVLWDDLSDKVQERFMPDDAETVESFTARMIEEYGNDQGLGDYIAKNGAPVYNGVVGDSHDCPACNGRRTNVGVDLMHDQKEGITVEDSEFRVKIGYHKRGMEVPEHATREGSRKAGMEKFGMGGSIMDILNQAFAAEAPNVQTYSMDNAIPADDDAYKVIAEQIRKTGATARASALRMYGDEDHPLIKAIDEATAIAGQARKLTADEQKKVAAILPTIAAAMIGAI